MWSGNKLQGYNTAQGLGLGTPAGHSLTPKVLLHPWGHLRSPCPLPSPPASTKTFFSLFFPRNPLPEAQAGQALALHPFPPNTPLPTHPLLQLQALNTAFMVKHGIPFLFKTTPESSQEQHSQPCEPRDELCSSPRPRGSPNPKEAPERPGLAGSSREQRGDKGAER